MATIFDEVLGVNRDEVMKAIRYLANNPHDAAAQKVVVKWFRGLHNTGLAKNRRPINMRQAADRALLALLEQILYHSTNASDEAFKCRLKKLMSQVRIDNTVRGLHGVDDHPWPSGNTERADVHWPPVTLGYHSQKTRQVDIPVAQRVALLNKGKRELGDRQATQHQGTRSASWSRQNQNPCERNTTQAFTEQDIKKMEENIDEGVKELTEKNQTLPRNRPFTIVAVKGELDFFKNEILYPAILQAEKEIKTGRPARGCP